MSKEKLQIKQTLELAYTNHRKGNLKLAESLYKKILKLDKNNFDSFFLLGAVSLEKKNFDEAIQLLNKAIQLRPENPNSYQNLGLAFLELGDFKKAKESLSKAIQIKPDHVDAHFNLGNVYKQMRNFKKAQMFYEKTIEIEPNHASALNNLGNVYKKLGEFLKAISSFNKAILIKPNHVRAYHNLANTFNQLGDSEKAIESLKKVLKYQPYNLESIHLWSELDKNILNLNLKKQVNNFMKSNHLSQKDLAYGNFILSKYEFIDRNFEKEFNYLIKGHQNYFDYKKTFFTKGVQYWINDLPKIKELEKLDTTEIKTKLNPIFIIGVPRCGSTLVEKIIASGSTPVSIGEETGVISHFVGEKILEKKSLNLEINDLQSKINKKYEDLELLKKENNYIFTDKTLDNFFFLALIKKIYPNAKIVHCKRNPIASIMSILKNNLGDVSWAHNIKHIFEYFNIYYNKINFFKKSFPSFIYDLQLENLQNNPKEESKKLMKFCELPWSENCLEFYKRKDLVSHTASNRQIRNPVYKDSEDKHKPYKVFLNKFGKKYSWYK